jgi:hypothetical protein
MKKNHLTLFVGLSLVIVLISFASSVYFLVDKTESGKVNPFVDIAVYDNDGNLIVVIDQLEKQTRKPTKGDELFFMVKLNQLRNKE